MVGVGKDRNLSDQIKSYLSLFWGRTACLRVSLRPTYFTIARLPWIPLAGRKEPLEIVKKKCTCAVGLARTWYCRRG